MKKVIILFCCVIGSIYVNAQKVVNIPDQKFKNALLSNYKINTNFDGEIQVSEAYWYNGRIDINEKGVSDLTGIEAFTFVSEILCSENNLTSIDVSKNIGLKFLWCSFNSLTSLDVSRNANLTKLYCHYNSITSLNVGNNTALKQLWCYRNKLTELDVSKNTILDSLYAYENNLTYLSIGANKVLHNYSFVTLDNPNLTCIKSDFPDFAAKTWSNIDPIASFSLNCGSPTAVEELTTAEANIKVLPNPFKNDLYLEYNLDEVSDVTIQLFSAMGTKVFESNTNQQAIGKQQFNFSGVAKTAGVYNLILTVNNKHFATRVVKVE